MNNVIITEENKEIYEKLLEIKQGKITYYEKGRCLKEWLLSVFLGLSGFSIHFINTSSIPLLLTSNGLFIIGMYIGSEITERHYRKKDIEIFIDEYPSFDTTISKEDLSKKLENYNELIEKVKLKECLEQSKRYFLKEKECLESLEKFLLNETDNYNIEDKEDESSYQKHI